MRAVPRGAQDRPGTGDPQTGLREGRINITIRESGLA
jgi:hypothetical protein